jgi:hypothetical protein
VAYHIPSHNPGNALILSYLIFTGPLSFPVIILYVQKSSQESAKQIVPFLVLPVTTTLVFVAIVVTVVAVVVGFIVFIVFIV